VTADWCCIYFSPAYRPITIYLQEGLKGPQVVYENTYQLAPKDNQKFPTKKAEDILKNVFLTHLLDSKYNGDTCKNLTTQITETVKTQVWS
jgi:hypothetical protein